MNSKHLLQLPFDLVEAILLSRFADLRQQERSVRWFYKSRIARLGPSWEQDHRSAERQLQDQVVACLCAIIPSRAMCVSVARLPALDLTSACQSGHIARLDKLRELSLCADRHGQALECAIANNNISVLEWWTKHSLPISDCAIVGFALECGAFDMVKWIADHQIYDLRYLALDSLQQAILDNRADVVHAWLDWKDANLVGDFKHLLSAASAAGCVDILERFRNEHMTRFLEAALDGEGVLERVLTGASKRGDARVVEWWITTALAHGLAARLERMASGCVQLASEAGHAEVLRVWRQSQVPLGAVD